MSDKKIDMSVFVGQDFDCEFQDRFDRWDNVFQLHHIFESDSFNGYYIDKEIHSKNCRPRLNHWHFNDGSMVLPDGLVVEIWFRGTDKTKVCRVAETYNGLLGRKRPAMYSSVDVIAVKIIGAHHDWAIDAKRLNIPVIED